MTPAALPTALLDLDELSESDPGHDRAGSGPVLATPLALAAGIALGIAVADAISVMRPAT
jgi:hypothetical protein